MENKWTGNINNNNNNNNNSSSSSSSSSSGSSSNGLVARAPLKSVASFACVTSGTGTGSEDVPRNQNKRVTDLIDQLTELYEVSDCLGELCVYVYVLLCVWL